MRTEWRRDATEATHTVVIGAGFAGIATSLELSRRGVPHVVLERSEVGAAWRDREWPSFRLNTPGWMNVLPGAAPAEDPDGFARAGDLRRELVSAALQLPVVTGAEVVAVESEREGHRVVTTSGTWRARAVVAASGLSSQPELPHAASRLDRAVTQLHSSSYRGGAHLPDGAVLVVGSGASGMQIAEELACEGRRVLLATSRVGRVPRRHRGRDMLWWWARSGRYDERATDVDPRDRFAATPHVSGADGGRTLGYRTLARLGVTLLGGVEACDGSAIRLRPDLGANIRYADEASARFRAAVDRFIDRHGWPTPPADPDPDDLPLEVEWHSRGSAELDLERAGVAAVVWSTGYRPSFGYLPPGLLDRRGLPRHGVADAAQARVWALGVPWLTTRASAILFGIRRDADTVAEAIARVDGGAPRPRRHVRRPPGAISAGGGPVPGRSRTGDVAA